MDERSLATTSKEATSGDSLNTEAMVRGVLRALEHLGFAEPDRRQPVEIEEVEEQASPPALPDLSAASLPALVLRRPRRVDAVCAKSASATALAGAAAIEAGGLPAASTSAEGPVKATSKTPTMAERWAVVEQQFEERRTPRDATLEPSRTRP